jgi:hypothetical protein
MLVGEGLDASCGPQLVSQKLLEAGDVEGTVGSLFDNGKCIKDSKEELGFDVNCRPNSIVDKMYLPTCLTASKWPGLGQCI